jgi:3-oxoacyl-[acyl-carrier-protein] synthase II
VPRAMSSTVSANLATAYKIKGLSYSISSACSTSAHCIGNAVECIQLGKADRMFAGGGEELDWTLSVLFDAMGAMSSKFNDTPTRASRAYDKDRDGFVISGGGGIVVLEELEVAKARGAKIYAEVLGYGMSGDAYHITAPAEDGDGGYRSMQMALKRAGLEPADIDYINAHGTSTMADTIELGAVERLMGEAAAGATMSSTKSSIGHLLGAAGAVEAIFCILALRDQIAPPTINLDNPAVTPKLDLAPNVAVKRKIDVALSNSFGFGGTNASLVLGRVTD